jgi:hypothetical protein
VIFYLGVHRPQWLSLVYEQLPGEKHPRAVPLFVSHSTLRAMVRLPRAVSRWALDSGAYTEITKHGEWRTDARAYAGAVHRYAQEIGNLDWAAPQDWTCDKASLQRSGLPVKEHQKRTVRSVLALQELDVPVIPVLQGWTSDDYERHVEMYEKAGVRLARAALVGVGSLAGRQQTAFVPSLLALLASRYRLRTHAFGLKKMGLTNAARFIASADSMAWSSEARREAHQGLAGAFVKGHEGQHASCSNCIEKALEWRAEMLEIIRSQGVKVENGLVVTAAQIVRGATCRGARCKPGHEPETADWKPSRGKLIDAVKAALGRR